MKKRTRIFLAIAILPATVWIAYMPGLSGGFHFDDLPNLSVLGHYGEIDSLQALMAYLQSSPASDLGRPVSTLSFLLNAQTWPAEPAPFLITNVLIHIANTMLLAFIVHALLARSNSEPLGRHALKIAVLAAVLWGCHPFLVSTTLYIVQRMAMLSAFFSLAAIALYLAVRLRVLAQPEAQPVKALLAAAGIGLLTTLSVLSKENGALTPLLILVIEYFFIRPLWPKRDDSRWFNWWLLVVLVLPALVLLLLLLQKAYATGLFEQVGNRPFTGIERMLAQPLILIYYLYCLFVPQPGYPGLFYDGHPLRLANPAELLPWLGASALAAALVLALKFRARHPLAAGAFVFFLAGHLIEAGVAGLEPIFEHRNYLPSTMLFIPIAAAAARIRHRVSRNAAIIVLPVALCLLTYTRASLWGEPQRLKIYWGYKNPESQRSQVVAANTLLQEARFRQALDLLNRANENIPRSAPILAMRYIAERRLGLPSEKTRQLALEAFRFGAFGRHVPRVTDALLKNYFKLGPEVLPLDFIMTALDSYIDRSDYQHRVYQTNLRSNRVRVSLEAREYSVACEDAEFIINSNSGIEVPLNLAARFANANLYHDALDFIEIADRRVKKPTNQGRFSTQWYAAEIKRLRQILIEDLQNPAGPSVPKQCSPYSRSDE